MSASPQQDVDLATAFRYGKRVFAFPEWKFVYVSTPKNACTSLKWVMAGLAGEDTDRITRHGLSFNPTRAGIIHHRARWTESSPLRRGVGVPLEQMKDEGWFVFGVLRDPRLRMFSAWQDKYLLQNPGYWRAWEREPRPLPTRAEDVIEPFAEFCRQAAADPDHPALKDHHFRSQVVSMREDAVPYTRLYDMRELSTLMADFNAHLAAQGHPGDLTLGRSNSSPFRPCGALFANGVREDIEKIYADDFARYGDLWDFAKVEATEVPWTEESFAHARSIIAVHERLADVVREGRKIRRRLRKNRRRVAQLERENQRLKRRGSRNAPAAESSASASTSRKVLRRGRAAVRRVRSLTRR